MNTRRTLALPLLAGALAGCASGWGARPDAAVALMRGPRDLRVVRAAGDTVLLPAAALRGDSIVSGRGAHRAVHRDEVRGVEVWTSPEEQGAAAVTLVLVGALVGMILVIRAALSGGYT
jgi:hypothetical protein